MPCKHRHSGHLILSQIICMIILKEKCDFKYDLDFVCWQREQFKAINTTYVMILCQRSQGIFLLILLNIAHIVEFVEHF